MVKDLIAIQNELKVPKDNYNSFGKYRYRSAEDILMAVKPLLAKHGCQMTISDEIIAVGNRVYVKATVTLTDSQGNIETVSALAREDENKKGMDGSQITGTASSYARKYALNGLFLIDDTKDADTEAYHIQTEESQEPVFDREFIEKHGKAVIGKREIDRLITACMGRTDGKDLSAALRACKKNAVEEITFVQYLSLCQNLGIAA